MDWFTDGAGNPAPPCSARHAACWHDYGTRINGHQHSYTHYYTFNHLQTIELYSLQQALVAGVSRTTITQEEEEIVCAAKHAYPGTPNFDVSSIFHSCSLRAWARLWSFRRNGQETNSDMYTCSQTH